MADKEAGMRKLAAAIDSEEILDERVVDIEKEWSEDFNLADYRDKIKLKAMVITQHID